MTPPVDAVRVPMEAASQIHKEKMDNTKVLYQKYVDMAMNQRTTLLTAVALYLSLSGYFITTLVGVVLDWPTHWGQLTPEWTSTTESIINGITPATASTSNKVCQVHALVGYYITALMTLLGIFVILAGAISISQMNRTRKEVQVLGRTIALFSCTDGFKRSSPFAGTIWGLYFIFLVLCCWVGLIAAMAGFFTYEYCYQPRVEFVGSLDIYWPEWTIGLALGFILVSAILELIGLVVGKIRKARDHGAGSDTRVSDAGRGSLAHGQLELARGHAIAFRGPPEQSAGTTGGSDPGHIG